MTDNQGITQDSPSHVPDSSPETNRQLASSRSHTNQTSYSPFTASPNTLTFPGLGDNNHGAVPHHPSAHPYYNHRGGFNPQVYPIPARPASTVAHTPPFPPYPSAFRALRIPEGGVMPQNPHIRYQPMLQPHVPVYYPPHPASAPIPAHFQAVQYQPPSRFTYPPQSFPSSPPFYQPYSHHRPYVSQEVEAQGAWYYLPPNAQQRTEGSPIAYQGRYSSSYPPVGPPGVEVGNSTSSVPQGPDGYSQSGSRGPTRNPESGTGDPSRSMPPVVQSPNPASSSNIERSHVGPDTNATSSSVGRKQEKQMVRKAYHPNPPPHRSEWAMWVGNIPSDATHEELLNFFSQPSPNTSTDGSTSTNHPSADQQQGSGVISVFLISKSSCVFVNYQAEEHLNRAIQRFNGRPLRPHDPKSLRLVCRVRNHDDDLKAGVGGQRGQGLHVKWIKDRSRGKRVQSEVSASDEYSHSQASGFSPLDDVDQLTVHTSDLNLSSDEEGKRRVRTSHRSSSGSFASTDSSLLSNFFPKRYFILKSLTQVGRTRSRQKLGTDDS